MQIARSKIEQSLSLTGVYPWTRAQELGGGGGGDEPAYTNPTPIFGGQL